MDLKLSWPYWPGMSFLDSYRAVRKVFSLMYVVFCWNLLDQKEHNSQEEDTQINEKQANGLTTLFYYIVL